MKAAVIGLGPHGRRMVEALALVPGVELCAVVDQRSDIISEWSSKQSASCYTSAEELWKGITPELICIATNGPSHASLALAAMANGVRRILVAKPLACSLVEGDKIVNAATKTGSRLAVDHIRRHAPIYRWLRDRVLQGGWGTLRCAWIQRPGIGLACNATHSFDLVRFLSGGNIRRVTAWVDPALTDNPRGKEYVDPGGLVVVEGDNGFRAAISQIEDGAGPASIELDFTAARVRLDERSGQVEIIERDLSVKPGPNRPPTYRSSEPPSDVAVKIDMIAGLRDALKNLLSTEPLECDVLHGLAAVEVLVAAHLSARRGNQPIELSELTQEDRSLWLPVT